MAVEPIPAVAAVLWRFRAGLLELYLAKRAFTVRFFGGFWSLPGGAVEPEDGSDVVACAREMREETGVEVAPDPRAFVDAGRWVTPAFSPIRFDARYYLVRCPDGAEPDHRLSGGEHIDGAWTTPRDALDRWSSGEWFVPYPIIRVLRALVDGIEGASERCIEQAASEASSPRLWELLPGIACSPLLTPTLPPATHTNCYVIGCGEVIVIDPATPHPDEREVLVEALAHWETLGRRVKEIWLTHHHIDHVGAVDFLSKRLGVPVAAHKKTAELVKSIIDVSRFIEDGDVAELAGDPVRRLRAVFTPGHAPGHLCFCEETTGLLVAGDMVASVGTIIIDPDEGDMQQYLDSLRRMKALRPRALLPAHGGAIIDADSKIDEYTEHRLWRESRVYEVLAALGSAMAGELVPPVYSDVPESLFPLAERSLIAHLLKLANDGRVRRDGNRWVI